MKQHTPLQYGLYLQSQVLPRKMNLRFPWCLGV